MTSRETYLVTGGAGFIGSHIAAALVRAGKRVRILDVRDGSTNLLLRPVSADVEFATGDVRDGDAVRNAARDVDVIFHQAARISVPHSIEHPAATFDVNIGGTLKVLEAARDLGVRRVIFASTCAVYGNTTVTPIAEATIPDPISPYAMSKLTGEQLCTMFTSIHGLETVALRYFNVYGAGQDPLSPYAAAIPLFLTALREGRQPTIFGDGEQSRDFVWVEDVGRANLLAALAPAVDVSGNVFNVGSGHEATINTVVETLGRLLGIDEKPRYLPGRPGDIRRSVAAVENARINLGFTAETSLESGLARLVDSHERFADGIVAL